MDVDGIASRTEFGNDWQAEGLRRYGRASAASSGQPLTWVGPWPVGIARSEISRFTCVSDSVSHPAIFRAGFFPLSRVPEAAASTELRAVSSDSLPISAYAHGLPHGPDDGLGTSLMGIPFLPLTDTIGPRGANRRSVLPLFSESITRFKDVFSSASHE